MKSKFHVEITQIVLGKYFKKVALDVVIRANIKQDCVRNLIGRDYIHFDGSAFTEGFAYINSQETKLIQSIKAEEYLQAWTSLGHILHSWQDFYSHSNYTKLWLLKIKDFPPEEINHNDPEILKHPNLKSGKNYGLFDFIALIPGISKLILHFMPSDSHAKMNLDSPKSGPYFIYAYYAALKRTEDIVLSILNTLTQRNISQNMIECFLGKRTVE